MFDDITYELDDWDHGTKKLPKAIKLDLAEIDGLLPFAGVRDPGARSSISYRIWMPYRTRADEWQPRLGIFESAAEQACALECLISPDLHDLTPQPCTVPFEGENGKLRNHTFDLRTVSRTGWRTLMYVRHHASLARSRTRREIEAIREAVTQAHGDEVVVVDASTYTKVRRANLWRAHACVFQPDSEADEVVHRLIENGSETVRFGDLVRHAPVDMPRAFRACYRLIAFGILKPNWDHVICEFSRLEVAE